MAVRSITDSLMKVTLSPITWGVEITRRLINFFDFGVAPYPNGTFINTRFCVGACIYNLHAGKLGRIKVLENTKPFYSSILIRIFL